MEQFRFGVSEYSIWKQGSYLGSYQIPPSPLKSANMDRKKLFDQKMPLRDDKRSNERLIMKERVQIMKTLINSSIRVQMDSVSCKFCNVHFSYVFFVGTLI